MTFDCPYLRRFVTTKKIKAMILTFYPALDAFCPIDIGILQNTSKANLLEAATCLEKRIEKKNQKSSRILFGVRSTYK